MSEPSESVRHPEWLPGTTEHPIETIDRVYPIDALRSQFDVRDIDGGWLVLTRGDMWLKFAALEFAMSKSDGSETMASVVFYGEGPGGKDHPLRECRHTYWGENGYLFYPNGPLIAAALRELSEFFDDLVLEKKK